MAVLRSGLQKPHDGQSQAHSSSLTTVSISRLPLPLTPVFTSLVRASIALLYLLNIFFFLVSSSLQCPGLTQTFLTSHLDHCQGSQIGFLVSGINSTHPPTPSLVCWQNGHSKKQSQWGKGIVREFGINMYTLLYLKRITNKDLPYSKETLLNVTWQPGWEGDLGEDGCMYMYGWVSSVFHLKLPQYCYQLYPKTK